MGFTLFFEPITDFRIKESVDSLPESDYMIQNGITILDYRDMTIKEVSHFGPSPIPFAVTTPRSEGEL